MFVPWRRKLAWSSPGEPEVIVNLMANATMEAGLRVEAALDPAPYRPSTGIGCRSGPSHPIPRRFHGNDCNTCRSGIETNDSTQGESYLNWMETHFHIQRRWYDYQFSLARHFSQALFPRVTNRYGCVTLHSSHFHVEAGLPQTQVLLWVSGEQLRAVFENVLLAEYHGHDDWQDQHVKEIRTEAFYPTRLASLLGTLIPFTTPGTPWWSIAPGGPEASGITTPLHATGLALRGRPHGIRSASF